MKKDGPIFLLILLVGLFFGFLTFAEAMVDEQTQIEKLHNKLRPVAQSTAAYSLQ